MQRVRVFMLWDSLDRQEQRRFLQYLDSPYYNQNTRLCRLAQALKAGQAGADSSKEALFEILYGSSEPYREQAVYDHLSFLLRHLEDFLALQAYEQRPAERQRLLLSALAAREQEAHFERHLRKATQYWTQYPFRDQAYYEARYQLEQEAILFLARQQRRAPDQHLQAAAGYLDAAYLAARLKFTCELLNRANILESEDPVALAGPIRPWLHHLPPVYQEMPVIQLYHCILLTLTEPEEEGHYARLVGLLDTHAGHFPPAEAADLYAYAQNYCILMINKGHPAYLQRLFDLYAQLLDRDLLLEEGRFDHRKYKNIVTVGLRLEAYDWVDTFLHRYRDHLAPEHRDNAFAYNLAALRYAQLRHREALKLLQAVTYTDVFYDLSARAMMLKIYYEWEDDRALESLFDSFRAFLRRNQHISAYQRTVHQNLLRYTQQLHRLRRRRTALPAPAFAAQCDRLARDMDRTREIANINWLHQQLALLRPGER